MTTTTATATTTKMRVGSRCMDMKSAAQLLLVQDSAQAQNSHLPNISQHVPSLSRNKFSLH